MNDAVKKQVRQEIIFGLKDLAKRLDKFDQGEFTFTGKFDLQEIMRSLLFTFNDPENNKVAYLAQAIDRLKI